MSTLMDDLDALDSIHDCKYTHRSFNNPQTFSSYTCPACIPIVEELAEAHGVGVLASLSRNANGGFG